MAPLLLVTLPFSFELLDADAGPTLQDFRRDTGLATQFPGTALAEETFSSVAEEGTCLPELWDGRADTGGPTLGFMLLFAR